MGIACHAILIKTIQIVGIAIIRVVEKKIVQWCKLCKKAACI